LFEIGVPVVNGTPVPVGRATPEGKIPEAVGRPVPMGSAIGMPVPEAKIPVPVGRATPEGKIPEAEGKSDGKVAFSRGKGGLLDPY
jgi:hypothetical protein